MPSWRLPAQPSARSWPSSSGFPGIEQRLCAGGEFAPNLQVSIDDVLSRRGLDARVQPASEVHFLPVFGGG